MYGAFYIGNIKGRMSAADACTIASSAVHFRVVGRHKLNRAARTKVKV